VGQTANIGKTNKSKGNKMKEINKRIIEGRLDELQLMTMDVQEVGPESGPAALKALVCQLQELARRVRQQLILEGGYACHGQVWNAVKGEEPYRPRPLYNPEV
jgi:hypothetical protein